MGGRGGKLRIHVKKPIKHTNKHKTKTMKRVMNVIVSILTIPVGIFAAVLFSLYVWFIALKFGLTEAAKLLIRKAKR